MTKEELEKQHEKYIDYSSEWDFFIRSYFGGKRYADGDYLIQHPFEGPDNYIKRKEQAYFYNYCQPIIDVFVSLLYKREPKRKFETIENNVLFKAFLADADLNGNSYIQFMREANRYASIYGRVSVIVDKPALAVTTQAQAREAGIRPYLALITPENIYDWGFARLPNGRTILDMVKVYEGPGTFRIWNRMGWELYEVDSEAKKEDSIAPIEVGEHNLGEVPIVNLYNKNSTDPMIGVSDIEDIARINRNIYYLCSDAQEIIENTAFPMLAMPYEKGGSAEGDTEQQVGPRNILQFDPAEPNAKPFWLEAPHSSLSAIEDRIDRNIKEIFKNANLSGVKTSDSKQPWSGVALDIENQQRDASLKEKADNMQQAEYQILKLWAKWEGKEFEGEVTYPSTFSIRDVEREIRDALDVLQRGEIRSPKFFKELQKKLVRSTLQYVDKSKRNEIYKEMEKTKVDLTNGLSGKEIPANSPRDSKAS